jgi:hypothetical protein
MVFPRIGDALAAAGRADLYAAVTVAGINPHRNFTLCGASDADRSSVSGMLPCSIS